MSYCETQLTPKLFTIEGNIGSGKSTFVNILKNNLQHDKTICFLQEPVDIWESIKDESGKNMIEKFYLNPEKYAFTFQMMAYISRLSILKKAIKKGYKTIISERSLNTDRFVFAKMLYDDGKIEKVNYDVYLKWFDEFVSDIPKETIVYIKADVNIVSERIKKRNRKGEHIPIEYLKKCDKYHDDWIMNYDKVIMLDETVEPNYIKTSHEDWVDIMKSLIY